MLIFKLLSYSACLIPFFSCFKLKYGIALCLFFEILVPPVFNLKLIGIPFNIRIFYALVYCIMLYKLRQKGMKMDSSILQPFFLLIFSLSVLAIFQWSTPIVFQLHSIFRVIVVVYFLPMLIWNVARFDSRNFNFIKLSFCLLVAISCLYGLFLTLMEGLNPYLMILYDVYTEDGFDISYSAALGEGRLFGRIQSTFVHPMTWSLFLCFSFVILYVFFQKERKKIYICLLLLVFFNIVISGVRTGIVVTVTCLLINLVQKKEFKFLFYLSIIVFLGLFFFVISNNELANYLLSIIDFSGKSSQVSGSSLNMRINQLLGCFDILGNNLLIGNGFSWNTYYMNINGDHPVLLAFESLLFVVLCNSGFVGILLWIYFFFNILRKRIYMLKQDKIYLQMLLFAYLGFALLTGVYDYLQQLAIYYSFLYSYLKYDCSINKLCVN